MSEVTAVYFVQCLIQGKKGPHIYLTDHFYSGKETGKVGTNTKTGLLVPVNQDIQPQNWSSLPNGHLVPVACQERMLAYFVLGTLTVVSLHPSPL